MALTHEQNEQLTRTGPGTLLGDLFRRYWVPALLADVTTVLLSVVRIFPY